MNDTKWTSGQWYRYSHWFIGTKDADGEVQYSIGRVWPDDTEAEANAHLIAAAPELYEALRDAGSWLDPKAPVAIHEAASAALARARGETTPK